MNTTYYNDINFGQKISTPLILKAGAGKINFEVAKALNSELGIKYSGHIGFCQRAKSFAEKIKQNNPELAKIFDTLKNCSTEELEIKIQDITKQIGSVIDVKI